MPGFCLLKLSHVENEGAGLDNPDAFQTQTSVPGGYGRRDKGSDISSSCREVARSLRTRSPWGWRGGGGGAGHISLT